MKKYLAFLFAALLLSTALSVAQDKATLSSFRVFALPGKDQALRKAIADHAAKFHVGNWKWRVYSVLSGSDEGSYMINEGPNSWTDLEGRKDISAEHQADYEKNVLPLTEKYTPHLYLTFQKELSADSTVGMFKKALLRHIYLKPGKGPRFTNFMKGWKQVYAKQGLHAVVWASFFSGQPQMVVSMRLTNGFTDLEKAWGKILRDAYDEMAGPGAYARYLEDLEGCVDRIDEEIIEFLPELSSK